MLLGVGKSARRHATSELRRRPQLPLRCPCLSSSTRKYRSSKLPYLRPGQFQPRPDPNPAANEIAVLGGGVTGLTTAYHLTRLIPHARVTVYEKSERFGGWIDSEIVPVKGGEVLFEWGPRSLRPSVQGAGWATVNLLDALQPVQAPTQLLAFAKTSKAATGRFIYYPDHLVRMPSGSGNVFTNLLDVLRNLWSEPLFKGVLGSLLREPSFDGRPPTRRDESVGNFLRRRFGPELTDNIASAVMHGIYAGDIYKLSMRTLLPQLWHLETRDPDNETVLLEGLQLLFAGKKLLRYEDIKFRNMTPSPSGTPLHLKHFEKASVVTWSDGMQLIVQSLLEVLKNEPRVTLKPNADIRSVAYENHKIVITEGSTSQAFCYAVSSLPPSTMKNLVQARNPNSLDLFDPINKSVSVMVVNLWFNEPVLESQYEGFGYLIPQSVPVEENPERALGVIFAHNLSGDTHFIVSKRADRDEQLRVFERSIEQSRQALAANAFADIPDGGPVSGQVKKVRARFETHVKQSEKHLEQLRATSDRLPDEYRYKAGQDTVKGSKIAVMLGGHWWDGWHESDYPSEEEGIAMAKSLLRRHLNITTEPKVAKARLQKDCIPQYPVGYRDMMAKIHNDVLIKEFDGKMKVAGPWYQGAVGVNDCIRRAEQAAMDIREGWDQNTGLETYLDDERWLLEDKDTGTIKVDPLSV